MPNGNSKGYALGLLGAGSILMYAGIKGLSIGSAIQNIVSGKSPALATAANQWSITNPATSGSGANSGNGSGASSIAAGPVAVGSTNTNGTTLYRFFRSHGYNSMQAAGAIASIWGESTWNPESAGTGGRGLIGWTPASTLPNSAFTGNAQADMAAQMPLILDFVSRNGDQGVVNQMASASSITQAALLWGHGVERFGISDVHPQGVAAAAAIAKAVDGVSLPQ